MTLGTISHEISRDVITASGDGARVFLHSQLANDVLSLAPHESRHSFLLEPTGKICSLVRIKCISDDEFVLDTDHGFGQIVIDRLNRFKIRVACELVSSTKTYFAVRNLSPTKYDILKSHLDAQIAWREGDLALDFRSPSDIDLSEYRRADQDEFDLARINARWPVMGVDCTADSIPAETGLNDVAVSFTKGCYPGQELVGRMHSRNASAPKNLRAIFAEPGARPGGDVIFENQIIGKYTTVSQGRALALINRSVDTSSIEFGS